MNKFIFTILILSLSFNLFGQEDTENTVFKSNLTNTLNVADNVVDIEWQSSFKKALRKSKKEKKPVLIYFTGSDWCSPCKILDKKLFHSERFKKIADKDLILYEANNPRNKDLVAASKLQENFKLINKYKVKSYPTLVFVDYKGKMIGYKKGLILTEYYYPFIESIIENY